MFLHIIIYYCALAGTAPATNYSQPPPVVPTGGYGAQSSYDSTPAPPSNQYSGYGGPQQGSYAVNSYGGQGGYSSKLYAL